VKRLEYICSDSEEYLYWAIIEFKSRTVLCFQFFFSPIAGQTLSVKSKCCKK